VSWLRGLVAGLRDPRFNARPLNVRLVINKVALVKGFLRMLQITLSFSLRQCSVLIHSTISDMNSTQS
jgi:hypothetical protein